MARSNSRWPPCAAGSMSQLRPRWSTSRLPAQRSPCSRAGGSSAAPNRARRVGSASRSRSAIAPVAEGLAVVGQAGEGEEPLRSVELRPGRRRLVRESSAPGGAPVLPSEARRGGLVQGRQRPAEVGLGRRAGRARPRSTRARGTAASPRPPSDTASTAGTRTASAAPSQRSPLASVVKNPGGGLGWVLANTRRSSARSKPIRLGDVAAPHDPRRSHRAPECRLHGLAQAVHGPRLGAERPTVG